MKRRAAGLARRADRTERAFSVNDRSCRSDRRPDREAQGPARAGSEHRCRHHLRASQGLGHRIGPSPRHCLSDGKAAAGGGDNHVAVSGVADEGKAELPGPGGHVLAGLLGEGDERSSGGVQDATERGERRRDRRDRRVQGQPDLAGSFRQQAPLLIAYHHVGHPHAAAPARPTSTTRTNDDARRSRRPPPPPDTAGVF